MSFDPVTAVSGVTQLVSTMGTTAGQAPQGGNFSAWLGNEMKLVNEKIIQADDGVRRLVLGESDNLHQVMITLEKAKTSFELMVQVRNKLLDAYQDIMRMSV